MKNMNLSKDDFTKRGKSTEKLISTLKKSYNPINNLEEAGLKPLAFLESYIHWVKLLNQRFYQLPYQNQKLIL